MKKLDQFVYYKVEWLEIDITNAWNVKNKTLYFLDEAKDFKRFIDKSVMGKNCVIKKITEFTEVIAWKNKKTLV